MSGETVYSRAADIIRERGWWDGTLGAARGECLVTALWSAARMSGVEDASFTGVAVAHGHLGRPPAKWNDEPHRTVEDVLLVLKELHVKAGGA